MRRRPSVARPAAAAAATAGLALAVLLAAPHAPLRLNCSASLPRGLYLLAPPAAPQPGQLVLACPPPSFARLAVERGYLPPGPCPGGSQPLGKLVLAIAGDRLDVAPGGITLDGRPLPSTASVAADPAGRPLCRQLGSHLVPSGALWLISPHPRSLDSRYFGPVAASALLGRLRPLATWGGADPRPLASLLAQAHAIDAPHPSSP
jgi:conjugative transfer signal peptidase TraF